MINIDKASDKQIKSIYLTLAGGFTDVETPSSIPNLEAKHIVADDTLPYWDGNVGRCRLVNM